MKCAVVLVALALLVAPAAAAEATSKQRTITQVVKLLQDMMDKSKTEGNTERELYAKYKCYCDTNEADKEDEIETLTEQIAVLEAKIEELMADNGRLSKEVAKLDADMAANKASQDSATTVRDKEKKEFDDLEADLTQAIDQMDRAIQTLADIGADQSLGESAADHKYMMAQPNSLIAKKLHTSVKQALLAASAFVNVKQTKVVESFLQAPFTGTYTAQSGEVVGILKDMRDTFKANLATARDVEAKAVKAYDKFMATAQTAYDDMDASHTAKQGELSSNDGDLSTKKTQLSDAKTDKADAEGFLSQLLDMCEEKAKEYKNRVMMRTNEEAAIAEAISILNSDEAFATFGGVDATKTGATSLLQRASIKRHVQAVPITTRSKAQAFLAAKAGKSMRVAKVLALLQANNPFATVLKEIQTMLDLIQKEADEDQEQLTWCKDERKKNNDELDLKNGEKDDLIADIDALNTTINDPKTGLKVQIENGETALEQNLADQKSETEQRTEDNLAYQKDIANLVEAKALLEKAIVVLDKYYAQIGASASLVQTASKQPAPPSTWADGGYKGQSTDGNGAIDMLKFILSETEKEETTAHDDEQTAQHAFEDSMDTKKKEQEDLLKSIATLKEQLAEKEEEKLGKEKDLKATEEAIAAIEAYLRKIKPGCDFIVANFDLRETARADESAALKNAKKLIEGTPAYEAAMKEAHEESLGDCKDICAEMTEDHVKCKACLADTSIPGYCAGHKGTMGC